MTSHKTWFDRWVEHAKNNRWLAPILLLGFVVILVAQVAGAGDQLGSYFRSSARLEVVAAEELQAGALDLTLRNTSENDAVITAIEGEIVSVPSLCTNVLASSATYHVPLPLVLGAKATTKIREVVPAHGVDRFTISPWRGCGTARLTLKYNRGQALTVPGT